MKPIKLEPAQWTRTISILPIVHLTHNTNYFDCFGLLKSAQRISEQNENDSKIFFAELLGCVPTYLKVFAYIAPSA